MKIDAELLIRILEERKKKYKLGLLLFGRSKKEEITIRNIDGFISIINKLVAEEEQKAENQANYKIDMNLFDEEQTYTNCTVQVLHNSITDEYSVGWWDNERGRKQ